MADTMTITETAADGTTTVIEISEATEDSTLIEDVIEALNGDDTGNFDDNADSDTGFIQDETNDLAADDPAAEYSDTTNDVYTADADNNAATDTESDVFGATTMNDLPEVMTVDEAYAHINDNHQTGSIGMTVDEAYASLETGNQSLSVEEAYADLAAATAQTESAAQFIPAYAATHDDDNTTTTDTATTDETDFAAQAHAAAAADAQAQADEFIASGDYAAAAEAREAAENEAYAAGNYEALHGSDSIDLTTAATDQTNAAYYEQQEAEYARSGDYEAAREAASNASDATGNADWYAGGTDHTAQADAEEFQMDYAAWEQNNAESYAQNAEEFAAAGNDYGAAAFADYAADHQAVADWHGDLGEHGSGDLAVYDDTSTVDSGGNYDASSIADYSSYDTDTTE